MVGIIASYPKYILKLPCKLSLWGIHYNEYITHIGLTHMANLFVGIKFLSLSNDSFVVGVIGYNMKRKFFMKASPHKGYT